MKKAISFVLAALMLVSAVPSALATNDYTQGTQVVYTATGSESYTITVPAQLAPGGNGTVTLQGTWAENRIITVTAEPTVTLTNSIKAEDQKVLNVHFDGISEAGSNTSSQTFTEGVSVDDITNALFGTWSGKFNYNVDITDTFATETASGSYVAVNNASTSQHDLKVNLSSDTITDFSSVTVTRYGTNLLDMSKLLNKNLVDNGDGTYTQTKSGQNSATYDIFIPAGTPIRAECDVIDTTMTGSAYHYFLQFILEDGTKETYFIWNGDTTAYPETHKTFDKNVVQVRFMMANAAVEGAYITFQEPILSVGDCNDLEYEPFVSPQVVTASADGEVIGLTTCATSSGFTLFANVDVEITCNYLKKN